VNKIGRKHMVSNLLIYKLRKYNALQTNSFHMDIFQGGTQGIKSNVNTKQLSGN
jgi:hypothetical protein